MRGLAGSVPETSVFFDWDLGKPGWKFCHMKTSARLPGWKQDEFWQSGWHRLELPAVFSHILSIPFNCSDTALRVAEAMIGAKVIIFVFHHVCFVSRIWHHNTCPGSLAISPLRNRTEISRMNPRRNLSQQPGQPGQPGSCEEACFSKVPATFQAWNQYLSHNLNNLANKPVHFFCELTIIMSSAKLLKLLSWMWTSTAFRSC